MFKRVLIGILLTLLMGGGILLGARDALVEQALKSKLDRLSKRIKEPMSFESITLAGLDRVTIRGLQVGADRWIYIQRIEVSLESEGLIGRVLNGDQPQIKQVALIQPTFLMSGNHLKSSLEGQKSRISKLLTHLRSHQTLKSSVRSDLPKNQEYADLIHSIFNRLQDLPHLEVSDARVRDTSGELFVHQLKMSLDQGVIRGNWRGEAPRTGYCSIEGSAEHMRVYCSDDFRLPLGRFEVAGRQLEWRGGSQPYVRLEGLHLRQSTYTQQGTHNNLPFSEVKLDLTGGLKPNDRGQLPLEAVVVFPGGGRVSAAGFASSQEISLSTQVDHFSMSSLAAGQRGTLSAQARVSSQWRTGRATFEGKIALSQAIVNHPKLAASAVGPFDLSAEGIFALTWNPRSPRNFRFEIDQAKASLGYIKGRLNATWDQRDKEPHLTAQFELPQLKGSEFAASIPAGLMPHLQPIELQGKLGFTGSIDLDFADLDRTQVKFKPQLQRLKVVSMNEHIDFTKLSGSFDTKFVMPNGDEYTRITGPETERWVELNEMPKLLPIAVTFQEDGAFYKHGGISLFHLRGSLIRNLKEGRFVRGGSTLTMQLIKNLYLHRNKTLSRKLEEVCLAWLIEQKLSKDEIITTYLNIVEFGENLFGVKEAAQFYFNKEPIDLTPEEISALTRLLPGPRIYAPYFHRKRLSQAYTSRVNRLLKLLQNRGHLKEDEWSPITRTSLWENQKIPSQNVDQSRLPQTHTPQNEVIKNRNRHDTRSKQRRKRARELSDPF